MTERPTSRYREMAVAIGLVVVGAVVALIGGHRGSPVTPGVPTAADTGGSSASTALALVALAAAGAALLVRNRARIALGIVLLLDAVGMVAVGVTPTRWAPLIGGVLVGLGALAIVVRARTWPQPRGRFEPADAERRRGRGDAWDALDRGEDPTV